MMKSYKNIVDSKIDWLGKVPNEWKVVKLKYALADVPNPIVDGPFGTQLKADEYTDSGVPLVRISNLDFKGNLTLEDIKYISEDKALEIQRSRIKLNDIIIGKTGATIGKSGLNDKIEYGIISSSCLKISVDENKLLPHFFKYYVTSANFQNIILQTASGSTRDTINITPMANLEVVIPTKEEQTKIAQYLDHKTATIDQLIQQKEKLIELLKEKRQAVIDEAVTKGLNPNAKMKDSGIEWLGEVPKHWKVARIGHYTQLIRGASPRPAGDSRYFGGDFMPWITVGEVTNGDDKFVLSTENYLTKEGSEQSRIIYPETLLLSNSGATLGVPKISKITGCINDGSVAFISLSNQLERDYLFYFFKTHTETYRQEMSGYGQPNLNTDIIKSTKIPLPPISEQIEIVNFIENEFLEFDKIISLSALQIDKMKEYRQSIISEAVTGKIDVRDWQPNKQQIA
jgi:type I restriction enzyme S subunit